MTLERPNWDLVKQAFHSALEVEGAERDRVLEEARREDPALFGRLQRLLAAHEAAGEFLGEVTVAPPQDGFRSSPDLDPFGEDPAPERLLKLQSCLAGRYTIEGELGRGGMGVVYLARDVSLDRPVAIKLLSSGLGARAVARDRFLQEARTAARLSHPNIVPVHAVEEHDDLLLFVMAFIRGETLRERIRRRGPMGVGEVSRVLQEVAWALDYAHGRGVVHRDIKPGNILLEFETRRSVVTDFGIAHCGWSMGPSPDRMPLGTPEFMSPEQIRNDKVDPRADLYSLGSTCFFALTGHSPFEAEKVQQVLFRNLHETPPPIKALRADVSDRLALAIDKCLSKAPEERHESAGELAHEAFRAQAEVERDPAPIRDVRRDVELMVIDGAGFSSLSAMAGLLGADPLTWGTKMAVWFLSIGIVGARLAQVIGSSRNALAQGFTVRHLCNAVAAGSRGYVEPMAESERFNRRSVLAGILNLELGFLRPSRGNNPSDRAALRGGLSDSDQMPGGKVVQEVMAILITLQFLSMGWVGAWTWEPGNTGVVLTLAVSMIHVFLIFFPVLVGRILGAALIRRWPTTRRIWAWIWQGQLGEWFFRATCFRQPQEKRAIPAPRNTEALIAGTALDLFRSLPGEFRTQLEEVPELVNRLEAAAVGLRDKGIDLERALAAIGPTDSGVEGLWRPELRSPHSRSPEEMWGYRKRTQKEISAARDLLGTRLSETLAALESLRLGLLRLHAGMGSPDEITEDLRAAGEIGQRVEALLDGEREVHDLLVESETAPGPVERGG